MKKGKLFMKKIKKKILKKYKEELIYLFKDNNDDKVLKQIEFIYLSILFGRDIKHCDYDYYPSCLGNDPKKSNDFFNHKYNLHTNQEQKKIFKKDDLALVNFDYLFEKHASNPFYNNAKYFKFPLLLKKNVFETNSTILDNFKDFLRTIYKSKLLEEIFYLTPEFNGFKYPLLDEEILEEMIDNTTFLPFNQAILFGYTQKQFGKVYISTHLPEINSNNDLSKLIIEISFFLNTLIYEQFNHYIKGLLFYNSFRFNIHKRLESDFSNYEEDRYYLDNIRSIFTEDCNREREKVIDGSHKTEIYLYGKILYKLYLREALKMYDDKTWNLCVKDHLIEFNLNKLAESKSISYSLKDIKSNKKINNFLKEIIVQFNEFYECNGKIKLDFGHFCSRKAKNNSLLDENEIEFDFSVYVERNRINIPYSDIDIRLLNLFNQ